MMERHFKFLHQIVAGHDFIREGDGNDANLIPDHLLTAARLADVSAEKLKVRASRCDRFSPSAFTSCCKSSGVSMSRAIRGSESTTQVVRVAMAVTRCGMKLSLPKCRENSAAGRRRTALVPRWSAE